MKALVVLGIILLALVLIGLIPVGVDVSWEENSFSLAVRLWFFSMHLGGKNGKTTVSKKEKKPEKKKTSKPVSEKSRLSLKRLLLFISNGYEALCRLVSRLRVELLRIHFTAAWPDPALTAMAYGAAGTAMEGLLAVGGDRIGRADLRADADFDGTEPVLDFRLRITIRICRVLGAALVFGWKVLWGILRLKKEEADNV